MEQAIAIKNLLGNEAINALWEILEEMAQDHTNELLSIIAKRPDTLTGKTAVKLAARAQALRDFKEAVLETQLALPRPSTPDRGRE